MKYHVIDSIMLSAITAAMQYWPPVNQIREERERERGDSSRKMMADRPACACVFHFGESKEKKERREATKAKEVQR